MDLLYGKETIKQVRNLQQEGVSSMIVLMRHSAREYNIRIPEEDNLLTDEGREYAIQFGKSLPDWNYRLFSSLVHRCVETSHHIEKGLRETRSTTTGNEKKQGLEYFYTKDGEEVFNIIQEAGIEGFLRQWFDGETPDEAIQDANSASEVIMDTLRNQLTMRIDNTIDICVSHDWNLYLIKEKYMRLRHEAHDKIEYLDGLILYQKGGRSFITNHQTDPIEFDPL